MNLALCITCSRHARGSLCPFCGSALPDPVEPKRVSRREFTRTAVAIGAAVVATGSATGCASEEETVVTDADETTGDEREVREEEEHEVFDRYQGDCNDDPGACTMPYGAPPDRPEWV